MIHNSIKKAYEQLDARNWDFIYCALDIHGTVADSDYKSVSKHLYPSCIEPLKIISHLPEIKFILFSCCYPKDMDNYFKLFLKHGINISYFNENPEVVNTETGCFDKKFYYNIIFEDKGGFEPYMWPSVRDAFLTYRSFSKRVISLEESKS